LVTTYIEAEALISTPHGSHQENNRFYVGNIGDHDIILGTDWLVEHNPTIDWTSYKVDLNRCPTSCTTKGTTKFQERDKAAKALRMRTTKIKLRIKKKGTPFEGLEPPDEQETKRLAFAAK